MIPPISDSPPPGIVDRRDGNTKGDCGITSTSCLFCKDQIAASSAYVNRYDEVRWAAKNRCQMATCPLWGKPFCKMISKDRCIVYQHWKTTGRWQTDKA